MSKRVMTTVCCYCGASQTCAPPPALVTCIACKRDFRVFIAANSGPRIELGKAAQTFFTKKRSA